MKNVIDDRWVVVHSIERYIGSIERYVCMYASVSPFNHVTPGFSASHPIVTSYCVFAPSHHEQKRVQYCVAAFKGGQGGQGDKGLHWSSRCGVLHALCVPFTPLSCTKHVLRQNLLNAEPKKPQMAAPAGRAKRAACDHGQTRQKSALHFLAADHWLTFQTPKK